MMKNTVVKDYLPDFVSKMKNENLADIVIETFSHYHNQALKECRSAESEG